MQDMGRKSYSGGYTRRRQPGIVNIYSEINDNATDNEYRIFIVRVM